MDHATGPVARERLHEFTGTGCLLQGLALLAPWVLAATWGVPGAFAGILLLLVLWRMGSALAVRWRCGRCRNPLAGGDVRVCPACGAPLG